MKSIYKIVFLYSFSLFLFSVSVTAQNKDEIKKNLNQTQGLVVFDASQSYSLQNSAVIFKDLLNPSASTSFVTLKQDQDPLGFIHQKMQQYFNGVKVEFATVTLSSKNGSVQSLSSAYFPIEEDFNVSPTVSSMQALSKAMSHVGANSYMW